MRNFLSSLRTRLLVQFLLVLTISAFVISFLVFSINQLVTINDVFIQFDHISVNTLKLKDLERDLVLYQTVNSRFFTNEDNRDLEVADSLKEIILSDWEQVLPSIQNYSCYNPSKVKSLETGVVRYHQQLMELSALILKKGFKNWGIEGELRAAIHKLEKFELEASTKILLLYLRRNEKDFLLRKDKKYIKNYDSLITLFKNCPEISGNSENLQLVDQYAKAFHTLTGLEEEIGFTETAGLKAAMAATILELETLLDTLKVQYNQEIKQDVERLYFQIGLLFVLQVILVFVISLLYSTNILTVIKQIQLCIKVLSNGEHPAAILVNRTDELGAIADDVNVLTTRIKEATEFAAKLGQNNYNASYNELYSNDVLARSLLLLRDVLIVNETENAKLMWVNKGLADFSVLLRSKENNVELLCNNYLRELVTYVKGAQGLFYLLDDSEEGKDPKMILRGAYAFGRRKYLESEIELGIGLAGQAWFEREKIFLTDVPKGYFKITSGLGEALPRCVLILPLIDHETAVGIIEIASFTVFEKHEIHYLEEVAELIASSIYRSSVASKTQKLLQELRFKSAEFEEQQEELRQQAEELRAMAEESERKLQLRENLPN